MPPEPSKKSKADEVARLNKYLDVLPSALEAFERSHPAWRLEALYWLLEKGLRSLRSYIESEAETEIDWASPFVELHFSVECDWEEATNAPGSSFRTLTGCVTTEDVSDDKKATNVLSNLMLRHIEISALQEWTNGVAYEKHGEVYMPAMDPEIAAQILKIPDRSDRESALRALFRPKSFGAGTVDYGDIDFESGDDTPVERAVLEQLCAIETPLVSIPVVADGHSVRLIAILEIHPLILDIDTREAHFPVVVGLAVQIDEPGPCGGDWLNEPWARLESWPKEEREQLWAALHTSIEASLEELTAEAREFEDVILSVNAQIRVRVPKCAADPISSIMPRMLEHFQATGDILKCDFSSSSHGLQQHLEDARRLKTLLERVETCTDANEKGKALEDLVAALFATVPGFEVKQCTRTATEEIDLLILNDSDAGPFRREGDVILAECKNWNRKCGKNEFVLFKNKVLNRGGRCTIGFLISWNGFARTVVQEMLRESQQLRIVPVEGADIRKAVADGRFLEVLMEARRRALLL